MSWNLIVFFSGAHCAVSLTLNLRYNAKTETPTAQIKHIERPVYWRSGETEMFQENLDILQVSTIEMKLDKLIETDGITDIQINEVVSNINVLFENCAKQSFGSKTVKTDNKYSSFKLWFNRSCINARNIFHKTRKLYNKYKTD